MSFRILVVRLCAGTLASAASAAVVKHENTSGSFVWSPVVDGDGSSARCLDITQPAGQSGLGVAHGFMFAHVNGSSTPHFNEDRIVGMSASADVARSFKSRVLTDEEGIDNTFNFARAFHPGATLDGSATFAFAGHIGVSNFYTDDDITEVLRAPSYLGVRITLNDGDHFGWIRIEPVVSGAGYLLDVRATAWAYETVPGAGIVIPAPGGAAAMLGAIGLVFGRRRR